MRWLDQRNRRTTERMAHARTPETRARIWRWSRVETIGLVVELVGLALLVAALIATIVLAGWFDVGGIDLTDVYRWLWGVAVGVTLVGAITLAVGSRKRLTSCYADGYVRTGQDARSRGSERCSVRWMARRHDGWSARASARSSDGSRPWSGVALTRSRPPPAGAGSRLPRGASPNTLGGAEGTRTPGLLDANETRYQLRHSPRLHRVSGTVRKR